MLFREDAIEGLGSFECIVANLEKYRVSLAFTLILLSRVNCSLLCVNILSIDTRRNTCIIPERYLCNPGNKSMEILSIADSIQESKLSQLHSSEE